jgi:pilus assembly protein CpaB
MNRNRLLIIGVVALGLAGIVSLLIYRFLRVATSTGPATTMTTVVAAATDLPLGTLLQESDLRLVKMPEADLPPGTYHNTVEVVGRGVVLPITKSELILSSKLASENGGAGLPSLIPAGMRGVSVKVNDVISVAGFVTPGTRVDVVLTGNPTKDSDPSQVTTTTVLENVQVLAAGQKLQRNEQGEPQQVTVITLLVNPDDAQKLVLASSEGRIQLALRNPLDTKNQVIPQIKNASLYRLQPGGAPEPVVAKGNGQMRHFAKAAAPNTVAIPFVVELIRGDKRDLSKF